MTNDIITGNSVGRALPANWLDYRYPSGSARPTKMILCFYSRSFAEKLLFPFKARSWQIAGITFDVEYYKWNKIIP